MHDRINHRINSAALVLHALVTTSLIAAAILGYDHYVRRPNTPRFAILDTPSLYQLKTEQLLVSLKGSVSSDMAHAHFAQDSASFVTALSDLASEYSRTCRCVLLARGAVVDSAALPDYTDAAKKRLGL